MEILIIHKKGYSVSNTATITKKPTNINKLESFFDIEHLHHYEGNKPELNEVVEVRSHDKIFSCIFVNNNELKIL